MRTLLTLLSDFIDVAAALAFAAAMISLPTLLSSQPPAALHNEVQSHPIAYAEN